ncbi:MAG: ion transporter [Gemmatimonadota bacterium]
MRSPLRERIHDLLFQHDDPAERAVDAGLIVAILLSVAIVMLDSVQSIEARFGPQLRVAEWTLTVIFSIEYVLRLWSSRSARQYAFGFYGIIDLLAVVPSYLAIVFPAGRFLIALRILRVLRVFRLLKLAEYVTQASVLMSALRASKYKITVFVATVLTIVVVVGSLMYLVEGPASGFTSIPMGVYWAIVTLTTVGYGDVAPVTPLGRLLASVVMIMGYGIIAVPTGIVTLELNRASQTTTRRPCRGCGVDQHDADARFCRYCGASL